MFVSWNVIFIWETGYWTRTIKRFALFDLLKVYIPIPKSCRNIFRLCRKDYKPDLVQAFLKKWWVESDFKAPHLPLSLRLKVSGCHYNNIYNNTWTKQEKQLSKQHQAQWPASPAYGVYISQLIRYARDSSNYSDFLKRHLHLRNRLLDKDYKKIRLIR
jgi:hypothetical protein